MALIGHFHVVSDDPGFQSDGVPSATEAPLALRRLEMANGGLVGTEGASTKRDYDMALKGLVVLAYRYGHLLDAGIPADQPRGVDFILNNLVPASLSGGHPPEIEIVEQSFLNFDTPETENHLLMIESSRYLFNQLRFDRRPRDATFNNDANRLGEWLLGYMQRIAKHDYLYSPDADQVNGFFSPMPAWVGPTRRGCRCSCPVATTSPSCWPVPLPTGRRRRPMRWASPATTRLHCIASTTAPGHLSPLPSR